MLRFVLLCTCRLKSQVEDMRLEDEARVGEVAEMQKKMTNLQAAVKKAKLLLVKTETEKQTTMESHQKIESVCAESNLINILMCYQRCLSDKCGSILSRPKLPLYCSL